MNQGPVYIYNTLEILFQLFLVDTDLVNTDMYVYTYIYIDIYIYVFIFIPKISSYMEMYLSSTYPFCQQGL